MALTYRHFQDEEDGWRIREFLRRVTLINDLHPLCWDVSCWDYWRWHVARNCFPELSVAGTTLIWETDAGEIAAVLNQEGPGDTWLQIHPAYQTPALIDEALTLLENLPGTTDERGRRAIYASSTDTMRHEVYARHGYRPHEHPNAAEWSYRRVLTGEIQPAPLAAGYTLRALGDGLELLERCYASGLAFHENDLQTAFDNRADPGWYRNIQTAPLYRRDLDLVAVSPEGEIAAFCTVWFDDVTRLGVFEPVATVPAHQRRGLGRALLIEGQRRLQRMGARVAMVGGFSDAARGLYASVSDPGPDLVLQPWIKQVENPPSAGVV